MINETKEKFDKYIYNYPDESHSEDWNKLFDFIITAIENGEDLSRYEEELEKLLVKRGVSKNTVYEILSYTEVSCRAIKYYIKKKSEEC